MPEIRKTERARFYTYDIAALGLLTVALGYFIWRAGHNFASPDESFYLTVAYRYLGGDGLLADEWHASQFFAFLIYPPLKLFLTVTGSTDGVILYFRYLLVAFQAITSVCVYLLLRKRLGWFAMAAAGLQYSYIALGLFGFSYYQVGAGLLLLAGIMAVVGEGRKPVYFVVVGVLTALSVTCNPVFAVLYFVYCAVVLLKKLKKPEQTGLLNTICGVKNWLYVTVGIAVIAVMFLVFLLAHTSISEAISNFSHMFDDPEHSGFFSSLTVKLSEIAFSPVWIAVSAGFTAVVFFDRQRVKHRKFYMIAAFIVFAAGYVTFAFSDAEDIYRTWTSLTAGAFTSWPFLFFGLNSYLLCQQRNRKVFLSAWLLGMLSAVIFLFSSNVGGIAMNIGFNMCGIISVWFVRDLYLELKQPEAELSERMGTVSGGKKKLVSACCILLVLSLTGAVAANLVSVAVSADNYEIFYVRNEIFNKEPANVKVTDGPYAGIVTTKTRSETYAQLLEDLNYIREHYDGNVLVAGLLPWAYYDLGLPYATFTAWTISPWFMNHLDLRFSAYYKQFPDKIPQVIYIPRVEGYYFIKNTEQTDQTETVLKTVLRYFSGKVVYESQTGYVVEGKR